MTSNVRPDTVQAESLSVFIRDAPAFLEMVMASGEPVILSDAGGAEIVVQDAKAYQKILDRMELLESEAALRESLEDARTGRTRPFRDVLDEIGRRHGLSR